VTEPSPTALLAGLLIALGFVLLTRLPVARVVPMESDELGFLKQISDHWFPMHHTLFMTAGRLLGTIAGDPYRSIVMLDMITSALALSGTWWFLRALVPPAAAAAGTLLLSVAPVFWGYGSIAANYTAIVAVGAVLLGIAARTRRAPEPWHPFAAAALLALGSGYRQDIGSFWMPVFLVILWDHRWRRAIFSVLLFGALCLAWLLPMLNDVGGWAAYRARSSEFAYHAGYLNSAWSLGLIDAPLRYAVKLAMALVWTLGPALVFVPRGALRLGRSHHGRFLLVLFVLTILPALASHLLVHFGSPGYVFHYVPALLALAVLGIGESRREAQSAPRRLLAVSALLAGLFLFYPTDYDQAGWRRDFDVAFARHTRIGLQTPLGARQPRAWRTANSGALAEREPPPEKAIE
jgi:hypothetical protein